MSDTAPTITQLALDLHTDLANIKIYADKSSPVVLALLIEAEKKVQAIALYIGDTRQSVLDKLDAVAVAA